MGGRHIMCLVSVTSLGVLHLPGKQPFSSRDKFLYQEFKCLNTANVLKTHISPAPLIFLKTIFKCSRWSSFESCMSTLSHMKGTKSLNVPSTFFISIVKYAGNCANPNMVVNAPLCVLFGLSLIW